MTGRNAAILAGAALGAAVLALVVRPLLPAPSRSSTTPTAGHTLAATNVAPNVGQIAAATARRDVACRPSSQSGRSTRRTGCGALQLTRRQTICPTSSRCQVALIGVLHSGHLAVPVALTVTLTATGPAWRVLEVVS
jgi:hypothetical protein